MTHVTQAVPEATLYAIGKGLIDATARTGKRVEKPVIRQWCAAFAKYSAADIEQAFVSCRAHQAFAPTIAEIRREIEFNQFGGAAGAWIQVGRVTLALRSELRRHFIVFEHPAIHFAIECVGALSTKGGDSSYDQHAFERAFDSFRSGLSYPAGFGTFARDNVVLIGNRTRALEVYRGGVKGLDGEFIAGIERLLSPQRIVLGEVPSAWPNELEISNLAEVPSSLVIEAVPWLEDYVERESISSEP